MLGTWGHLKSAGRHLLSALPFAGRINPGGPLNSSSTASLFQAALPGSRVPVSETTALNLSAVWAATRVISGAVSVLPLHVYAKDERGGREEVSASDPAAKLCASPNPWMTAVTFWETIQAHCLIWGNAYAEIERDGRGRPVALWPLAPNCTRPLVKPNGSLVYEYSDGQQHGEIQPDDVLHVPGLGFDGLQGYSVVHMARRSLGLNATAEEAGASFFGSGMRPGGAFTFPGTLQQFQQLNFEETTQKQHAGSSRFGKPLLLYGGLGYQSLGIPPTDAQFLETRQFQTVEVSRWFNLPPHKIRDLTHATFSNIEHQGQEFVTDTLIYWLTKITQEFGRKLLPSPSQYAEHTLDALLRGDTLSRYTAYGMGRQWGFLSANDCRRKENMPPIPGGDAYHVPVNMSPSNKPAARAIAIDIAREVAHYDADELAQAQPCGRFQQWIAEHAGPGGEALISEVIQNRCRAISNLIGRVVNPDTVAAIHTAAIREKIRQLLASDNQITGGAKLVEEFRSAEYIERFADSILCV